MKQSRKHLALLLVLLFLVSSCASLGTTSQPSAKVSPEWAVFYALESSIRLYDVAMTTSAELYRAKIINEAQWLKIKRVGKQFYDKWVLAEKAARKWSETPADSPDKPKFLQEVNRLMAAYMEYQTQLAAATKK